MTPPGMPQRGERITASTMVIHSARGRWYFVLDCLLTVLAWCVFIYLFARGIAALPSPSTSSIALPWLSSLLPTLADISVYVLAMVLQACILFLWARYNHWRFHRVQRREPPAPVTPSGLQADYGISAEALAQLRTAPISVIHFDDHEHIVRITHSTSS